MIVIQLNRKYKIKYKLILEIHSKTIETILYKKTTQTQPKNTNYKKQIQNYKQLNSNTISNKLQNS